jgi:hypothetical protein
MESLWFTLNPILTTLYSAKNISKKFHLQCLTMGNLMKWWSNDFENLKNLKLMFWILTPTYLSTFSFHVSTLQNLLITLLVTPFYAAFLPAKFCPNTRLRNSLQGYWVWCQWKTICVSILVRPLLVQSHTSMLAVFVLSLILGSKTRNKLPAKRWLLFLLAPSYKLSIVLPRVLQKCAIVTIKSRQCFNIEKIAPLRTLYTV